MYTCTSKMQEWLRLDLSICTKSVARMILKHHIKAPLHLIIISQPIPQNKRGGIEAGLVCIRHFHFDRNLAYRPYMYIQKYCTYDFD